MLFIFFILIQNRSCFSLQHLHGFNAAAIFSAVNPYTSEAHMGFGFPELIFNANHFYRTGYSLHTTSLQHCPDHHDRMLFCSDNASGFFCSLQDNVPVDGFDGMDVDHQRLCHLLQAVLQLQRILHHQPVSNDTNVCTVLQQNSLAQLKLCVFIINNRHIKAT